MPGAVPITSTYALTNATMPYMVKLADKGLAALAEDPGFLAGLNVFGGKVTYAPVAEAVGVDALDPRTAVV
jgi:alanine dehydrogenase